MARARHDEVLGAEAATKGCRGPVGRVQPPLREEVRLPPGERDGYLTKNKNTGLGFLSHETKQTKSMQQTLPLLF